MFCERCGTQIEDDSTFCHNCGNKIESQTNILDNEKQKTAINTENDKRKTKQLGILAVIVVVIIVAIVCLSNYRISVDLNQYVTITTDGYDSLGKAEYQFDYNAFYEDYKDKIKMQTQNGKSTMVQDWMGDNYFAVEMLVEYLDGNLSQNSKLSNGDTVTFSWFCEDDVVKELFNCDLKYSDINIQVSGLEEILTFDPFQDIDVEIEGILPKISVSIKNNSNNSIINDLYFSAATNPTLKNGDKVVVQAAIRGTEEAFIEKYGMLPSPMEKEYVVDGFYEHIFTKDQLTKEHMEELENLTYKELQSESWSSNETIENVEFLGTYITSQKEPKYGDYEEYGSIYVVCKVKVNCSLDTTQGMINYPVEYYYYVNFENIILDLDGGLVQENAFDTCYGPFNQYNIETGYYHSSGQEYKVYYYGYENLEDLYKGIITNHYDLNNYNCENNVNET